MNVRRLLLLLAAALPLAAGACSSAAPGAPAAASRDVGDRWGIVIHGGAGSLSRAGIPPERQAEYEAKLREALAAGHAVLARGGEAMDAVQAAVRVMEDSPLFNAGKGAVFTHEGRNELDAALMDGRTMRAGAVAGVRHIRNPIDLARAVMDRSPHVMLTGDGAEEFARTQGFEMMPESYFRVESRWQALQRALEEERRTRADSVRPQAMHADPDDRKFGTVGAVALDRSGNLAAGTSTGGMTNKRWGRVGDAPVIGAGTYANPHCAVSATGHGEFFIRNTVAREICALVEYRGMTLRAAADEVVMRRLVAQRGDGGVIAMDAAGNWALPFNSGGMFRGRMGADGRAEVAIFRD